MFETLRPVQILSDNQALGELEGTLSKPCHRDVCGDLYAVVRADCNSPSFNDFIQIVWTQRNEPTTPNTPNTAAGTRVVPIGLKSARMFLQGLKTTDFTFAEWPEPPAGDLSTTSLRE